MFLGEKIQSVDEFINRLEEYIAYWNNQRISPVLGQELKTLLEMSFTMQKECGDRNGRRLRIIWFYSVFSPRSSESALSRAVVSYSSTRPTSQSSARCGSMGRRARTGSPCFSAIEAILLSPKI